MAQTRRDAVGQGVRWDRGRARGKGQVGSPVEFSVFPNGRGMGHQARHIKMAASAKIHNSPVPGR